MADSKNNKPVKEKAIITFKNKTERNRFHSGATHSDKGIRDEKGRLVSQPDIKSYTTMDIFIESCLDEVAREVARLAVHWIFSKGIPFIKDNYKYLFKKESIIDEKLKMAEKRYQEQNQKISEIIPILKIIPLAIDMGISNYQKNKNDEQIMYHLIKIIILSVQLSEEIKKLSNFCDDLNLQDKFQKLLSPDITNALNDMLMKNYHTLDDEVQLFLAEKFDCLITDEGKYIPFTNDKLKLLLNIEKQPEK